MYTEEEKQEIEKQEVRRNIRAWNRYKRSFDKAQREYAQKEWEKKHKQ